MLSGKFEADGAAACGAGGDEGAYRSAERVEEYAVRFAGCTNDRL
jgi:hypothetical protein